MDSMRYFMAAGMLVGAGYALWCHSKDLIWSGYSYATLRIIAAIIMGAGIGSLLWQFA